MRALFLLLLLANILFFAWGYWVAPPREMPGFAAPSHAESRSIRLVRESPLVNELSDVGASGPDGAPDPGLEAAQCVSIGPFTERAAAGATVARLADLGFTSRPRDSTDEVWAGHWVRVPDLATPEDANNAIAALKALGVTEAVVVADEETPGNVVSLGVFSEQAQADDAAALARQAGLNPVITDRFRTADVFWVDVDRKDNAGLPRIEDLSSGPGRISRLEMRACPVAPTPASPAP
jgi:hypothetical protein